MIKELLFLLVLFIANTVQTITGFAGNLIAMPFSIRLVGIEEAKAVINIFTMVACAYLTWQNRKKIQKKILAQMVLCMCVGMAVGVWLFDYVPQQILITGYAILIILVALKKIFIQKEVALPKWMLILVLFAAGIIHGMFISGGALLVVYAVTVLKEKEEFRATVAPVWVILDAILMISHYRGGYYTSHCLTMIGWSMIPLVVSILVGNYLFKRLDQKQFLAITYPLLVISGVSLL